MNGMRSNWAVVLAAGEGTRLAALTRDAAGNAVPKQFCSPRRVAATLGLLSRRGPTATPDRVALPRRAPPPAFVNIATQQRRLALLSQ
jgi:hypothetical protein